jgi:hypothetical protein
MDGTWGKKYKILAEYLWEDIWKNGAQNNIKLRKIPNENGSARAQ